MERNVIFFVTEKMTYISLEISSALLSGKDLFIQAKSSACHAFKLRGIALPDIFYSCHVKPVIF
jgi:hypothetical protein